VNNPKPTERRKENGRTVDFDCGWYPGISNYRWPVLGGLLGTGSAGYHGNLDMDSGSGRVRPRRTYQDYFLKGLDKSP